MGCYIDAAVLNLTEDDGYLATIIGDTSVQVQLLKDVC